jgi:hypothetical protein
MNLDSFKNIKLDLNALKNFSIEDVRNFINEQQVLALNIAIALAAFTVGAFVVNMRLQEYVNLKSSLDELVVKEEPAHKYDKLLKDKHAFFRTVPATLSEEEAIPYLAQLADKHNVTINELQPPYERVEGFYREVRVVFSCSVANFHDAMMFMNDIESSKYMLKVNSWSFSPKDKGLVVEDPRVQSGLSMSLDISSMRLIEK